MLDEKIIRALEVANRAHAGQLRKGTKIPYIIHPINTMGVAMRYTRDSDILAACLMHDIIEDVPDKYPVEKMREEFGETVTGYVLGVSEDKNIPNWRERKEGYLRHLTEEPAGTAIVSMADKIQNLSDILRDYDEIGEKVWEKFYVGKDEEFWYYDAVYQLMIERDDVPREMVAELGRLVERMKKVCSLR